MLVVGDLGIGMRLLVFVYDDDDGNLGRYYCCYNW